MLRAPIKESDHLKYVLAGMLYQDYILNPKTKPALDVPGGQLLYTAAGIGLWDGRTGLISRVGSNYPSAWLAEFRQRGFDTRGVQVTPEALDLRAFVAYDADGHSITDNPLGVFAKTGVTFPKNLLGYVSPEHSEDRQRELTSLPLKIASLPDDYFDVSTRHICPLDYNSQMTISALMHNRNVSSVCMEAGPYTNALNWERMPALIKGLAAYHITEDGIRQLFLRRATDLMDMAKALAYYGCENIVILRGLQGQLLYNDHQHKFWEIPAYPSRQIEPRGYSNVFCGGFLAGFRNTYDPLQSVLYGNVAASLAVEGSSAFYCMDALPDLARMRLETLKTMVREL